MSDQRLLKLCELWERTSAKSGKKYFSGYLGDLSIVMFDGGEKEHPTRPGETVHVWRLFAQERDPSRRPQRPPAADAARGQQTDAALRERARQWTPQERAQHEQELAERFQPDTEIPF